MATVTEPSVRRTAGHAIGRTVASSTSSEPYSSVVLAAIVAAGISWRIATRSCSLGRPSKGRRTSSLLEGELMPGSLPIRAALHEQLRVVIGIAADDAEAAPLVQATGRGVGLDDREAHRRPRTVRRRPPEALGDESLADAPPPRLRGHPEGEELERLLVTGIHERGHPRRLVPAPCDEHEPAGGEKALPVGLALRRIPCESARERAREGLRGLLESAQAQLAPEPPVVGGRSLHTDHGTRLADQPWHRPPLTFLGAGQMMTAPCPEEFVMVALTNVITLAIDRAREAADGHYTRHLVRTGPLQQTVIALREGVRLAEHESEVPATIYILYGAIRVDSAEPFVLESGYLHEMPAQRRSVEAISDTVMLLTAVPGPDSVEGEDSVHVLPPL